MARVALATVLEPFRYTGLLAPHRRHDIEYIPHIGLGYFGAKAYDLAGRSVAPLDQAPYTEALRKAEAANLDFEPEIDKLMLVELNDGFAKISIVREFSLPR